MAPTKQTGLPAHVKTEVESTVAQGRATPHNWRHVALDIADQWKVDFHDVEAFMRKVMHQ